MEVTLEELQVLIANQQIRISRLENANTVLSQQLQAAQKPVEQLPTMPPKANGQDLSRESA